MENQEKLEKGIGTKEPEVLKPARVKVENIEIITISTGKGGEKEKVVCTVKHPDKEELIQISKVQYRKGNEIRTSGLWYVEDEDHLIAKRTALAELLSFMNSQNLKSLVGKEIDTVLDNNNKYLCFKAY